MSLKTKLISTISAICMVLALLTVGVWAVSTASVTLGGSVSFTADNVHARITGNVTGTQETISLPNLEYDVNTDVNSTDFQSKLSSWSNNDMTFTSENLITMTITNENLSEERSLFVTLTDNTTTDNVGKTIKQGASNYTSATAVEVTAGNTTTFTMTLSVTDKNLSASATVSYQVELRDANAEEQVKAVQLDENKKANGITYALNDETMTASITAYDDSCNDNVVIPGYVSYGGKTYNLETIKTTPGQLMHEDEYGPLYSYGTYFSNAKNVIIEEGVKYIDKYAFAFCAEYGPGFKGASNVVSITIPSSVIEIGEYAFGGNNEETGEDCGQIETVIINSETVASGLTSNTSQGWLIYFANTIYIKTDIVTAGSVGSYVTNTANFPNVETITSGEYAGYTKFSK